MAKFVGNVAVVVGAGMGGMMAAGVLSKFFSEVVVLEKDTLPDNPEVRKSVPQGAHAHILLVQGCRNLERIFPGFSSEIVSRGAVRTRSGLEFLIRDGQGWHPKIDLGLSLLSMTYPLLDSTVRGFVERNDRIRIRENVRVKGWEFAGGTLTGVVTEDSSGTETIQTDFVIDATGRSGNSLSWLEAGGFGPVEETALEIGTGYASALFKKPVGWKSAVHSLTIRSSEPDTRSGFIFSVENDCWIVSLIGRFDQQPSGDPDEFLAFAKSLCEPDIFDWASQGDRITPIKTYKAPISRWRHYEKLDRFPERILPVGDAVAHSNPLFGQGMTVASTHAMDLWELLTQISEKDGTLDGIAKPYFERVQGFTRSVWKALENVEFGFSGTRGPRPVDINERMAYARGLRKLIEQDPEVHKLLISVGHLAISGDILKRPDIAARVMEIVQEDAKTAQ